MNISFHKSIGTKLLRVSFFIYMIVTIIITSYHLFSEYFHAEKTTISSLKKTAMTFNSGIAAAIWNYEDEQLLSILSGAVKITPIDTILIKDAQKQTIGTSGLTIREDMIEKRSKHTNLGVSILHLNDQWKKLVNIKNSGSNENKIKGTTSKLYSYEFPIRVNVPDEQEKIVGYAYVYMGSNHVIDRVKHGFTLIIVNAIIKTFALWLIFLLCTNNIVTKPLKIIFEQMHHFDIDRPKNMILQNKEMKRLMKRSDEVGALTRIFNKMVVSIVENVNEIRDLNKNLEFKVKQRTREIEEKKSDMQTILTNIKQGILSVGEDSLIGQEYSLHLEKILEVTSIPGKSLITILSDFSDLSKDKISVVESAINACIGFSYFTFQLNEDCFPKEVEYSIGTSKKTIELDWQPIIGGGKIFKIMIVMRDVTAIRTLKEFADQQKMELRMVGEILAIGAKKSRNFIIDQKNMINELMQEEIENSILLRKKQLFRLFHTVKGNCRMFGFSQVADTVHKIEDHLSQINEDEDNNSKIWKNISVLVEKIIINYDKYINLIDNKITIEKEDLNEDNSIIQFLENMDLGNINKLKTDLIKLQSEHREKIFVSVEDACKNATNSFAVIAEKLGKKVPKINIVSQGIYLKRTQESHFINIINHLIRNSLDHGIEAPKERTNKKKDPRGQINMIFLEREKYIDCVDLEIFDDGRGLNVEKIRKKCGLSGLVDDYTVANNIFHPGFSSADKVTDISGRGVGLDAVKSFLEKKGGGIKLEFTGLKNGDYRPFKFVVSIPNKIFSKLSNAA